MIMSDLTRRTDYAPPPFWIREVHLEVDLDLASTTVAARLEIERDPRTPHGTPLALDGEDLTLLHARVDGIKAHHEVVGNELRLLALPDRSSFSVEVVTQCHPEANLALRGLYASNGGLYTQCEAEGFRRITFFLDRPDVMAVYTVTLRADKVRFPTLLSNGNLVASAELSEGRHAVTWHDPFPKPSYLFALVAADLAMQERRFESRGGSAHAIQLYARPQDNAQTGHAMDVLLKALAWDETRWGLSLDLERFMVVAVSDFNAGAMENKGLNIFNTKFVLASPDSATDEDFAGIDSVVSHEYFHNWTGNRITCRDWFQLSLKEGLTVYREQEFLADQAETATARGVRRIKDVRTLRLHQFPEDAGTMAHAVRPESYVRIDNFYTPTVYKKGAEVVRMMGVLVGSEGFRRGMDLYVERHDGQAVTCDDFARAIADANPGSALAHHLDAFMRWYSQVGTPILGVSGRHDPATSSFTLELTQRPRATDTPGRVGPLIVPVRVALLDRRGAALPLRMDDAQPLDGGRERVIVLSEQRQSFRFLGIDEAPVPSVLRGFSAPVIVQDDLDDPALLLMLKCDDDPFNRWEAGQRLAMARLLAASSEQDRSGSSSVALDEPFVDAMRSILRDSALDASFRELTLTLPAESMVAELMESYDPHRVHQGCDSIRRQLAERLREEWASAWEAHQLDDVPYRPEPSQVGRRALANLALRHLVLAEQPGSSRRWSEIALERVVSGTNMTHRFGALEALVEARSPAAEEALSWFQARYSDNQLVMDKWFALQASAPEPLDRNPGEVLRQVEELLRHKAFSLRNPNRVRSVLGTFCQANPAAFHLADGSGYAFWVRKVIELDRFNPSVAARIARALDRWRTLAEPWQYQARNALAELATASGLSPQVAEVIGRALADEQTA